MSLKNYRFSLVLVALLTVSVLCQARTKAAPIISLTATTNKSSYYIREPVALGGNVSEGGLPALNYLTGVEVDNHLGTSLLFRTVSIGNPAPTPPLTWQVQTTAVYVADSDGNPTDTIPLNSLMRIYATIKNNAVFEYNAFVTRTVLDGNLIPITAISSMVDLSPGANVTVYSLISVPEWAYSGKALAVVDLYDKLPSAGGIPLAPEASYVFYLTRNAAIKNPNSVLPSTNTSAPGQYGISFRMPPDIYTQPGTYQVYATTVSPSATYLRSTASTSFNLLQYPSPPQAAFTFTPLQAYGNMTVTFDGTSSSAEGPNATITQYEWTISDPFNQTHVIGASPYQSHKFAVSGTYVVQLNVTNSYGLWSTTSKPVVVLPDYGPTANFTWAPLIPSVNRTATFDASSSQTGWSAQISGFAQITSYTWNFSDGTINTTSSSTTQHAFGQAGNFTVTLKITDSASRTSQVFQRIQVVNRTLWDLDGDGGVTDMRDIAIAAAAYLSSPGSSNWNPVADITGPSGVPDGLVDMMDIAMVASHFLQQE